MTILMISTMLLLVNASLIPTNDLPKADQEEGTDPRGLEKRVVFSWMKSLMRTKGNTNDVHTSNAHLEIPASVIVDPNVVQQKVSDIFKNLKYSVSFGETFAIAIKEGASVKHAEQLAYRFHDPSKDQFSQLDNWLKMKDSQAKEGIKEKLWLNPHHRELLAWKGGFEPTQDNLVKALDAKNADVLKYFLAREPNLKVPENYLNEPLNPDILKILKENNKAEENLVLNSNSNSKNSKPENSEFTRTNSEESREQTISQNSPSGKHSKVGGSSQKLARNEPEILKENDKAEENLPLDSNSNSKNSKPENSEFTRTNSEESREQTISQNSPSGKHSKVGGSSQKLARARIVFGLLGASIIFGFISLVIAIVANRHVGRVKSSEYERIMLRQGEFTKTKGGSTIPSVTGIDSSSDMETLTGETASVTSAAAILKDYDTGITYYLDPETGYYYYYDEASKSYQWYS